MDGDASQRVAPDPLELAGRVVQTLLEQIAPADGGLAPEALISMALGRWLTGAAPPDADPRASDEAVVDLARYHDLLQRNSELAAALGACDCWGEEPGCVFCDGAGRAGWERPDRPLFERYVTPALRPPGPPEGVGTVRRPSNQQAGTPGKEHDHG